DRISEYGFITFSDLRDAVARNSVKLADVADASEFVRGDPLLRLDRRLAAQLDGVYRPSEVYLRLLQRFSSLNFRTAAGRWFTLFVTLPFGAPLVLLEAVQQLVDWFDGKGDGVPIFSPVSFLVTRTFRPLPVLSGVLAFLLLGTFLLGLLHAPAVQQTCRRVLLGTYRALHAVFIVLPARLWGIPLLRQFVKSWPAQLLYWYLVKPLILCVLVWLALPVTFDWGFRAAVTFLVAALLVNSRLGQSTSEAASEILTHFYEWVRADFLVGLFRFILRLFKRVTDTVEYVLYTVDEWLRFRSGDSVPSGVLRAVAGVLWFPVGYLARIYT